MISDIHLLALFHFQSVIHFIFWKLEKGIQILSVISDFKFKLFPLSFDYFLGTSKPKESTENVLHQGILILEIRVKVDYLL